MWRISNVDLHSSKARSKSCFCYLAKFLTILYLFILFIFKKKIKALIFKSGPWAWTYKFEHYEEKMDNKKLNSSWPSPFKARYLRPDKCIFGFLNSDHSLNVVFFLGGDESIDQNHFLIALLVYCLLHCTGVVRVINS